MTKQEKGSRANSALRSFIAAGLVFCVTIIIAAGWLGKSDNPGGKVAHVKTNSTTGSR
jgi:hypothetical protein